MSGLDAETVDTYDEYSVEEQLVQGNVVLSATDRPYVQERGADTATARYIRRLGHSSCNIKVGIEESKEQKDTGSFQSFIPLSLAFHSSCSRSILGNIKRKSHANAQTPTSH